MGHQQGVFDVLHLEATAAAIGGMGTRVANWYPAPKAGLNPSQLAGVHASLALRMAGARQPRPARPPATPDRLGSLEFPQEMPDSLQRRGAGARGGRRSRHRE